MNKTYQLNAISVLLFTLYYLKSYLARREFHRQVLEIKKPIKGNIRQSQ